MNRVTLYGHLGAKPELKKTAEGKSVCNLRLATNERVPARDGGFAERTEWHSIVVWGASAESCAKFLEKGSGVIVEGSLRTRSYQDRSGNRRYVTEVHARPGGVQFLARNKNGQAVGSEDAPPPAEDSIPAEEASALENIPGETEDIPF